MAVRFSVETDGITRTFEVKRSVITFGRSRACTVFVDDSSLSRTHCQLEVEEAACWVRDLNSRNGTFLGTKRVDRARLDEGDVLTIGKSHITFEGRDVSGEVPRESRPETARWTERLFARGPKDVVVAGGRDAERELRRMRRLLELTRTMAAELEPERVLTAILDAAIEFTEAERGFLLAVEDDRLYIPVARDFWRKDIESPAFEVSRSIALEVVRRGEPVVSDDASDDTRFDEMASVYNLKIRSVLCVPLIAHGTTLGAIYLDNRFTRGTFTEQDSENLAAFADQAAVSLLNSGLYEKSRQLSSRWKEKAKLSYRELKDARAHVAQLERAGGLRHEYKSIVGRSDAMRECLALVDRVTDTDLAVLLYGESGTGKELLARHLHANGPRRDAAFVAIDCTAFSPGIIETELFGHARGAFTGSVGERRGLFEEAHGGTVFLDEIGDMDLEVQKRLLRVLETGEIRRIGDTESRRVDVRVISATHRDLAEAVASGEFREDLLYRIRGVRIDVPPLRERGDDVAVLIHHFLGASAVDVEVSPGAMKRLMSHEWRGNVRELKNEMDRLIALEVAKVTPSDLSPSIGARESSDALIGGTLKSHVEVIEKDLIKRILARLDGNKTHAAEALGLSRVGLRKKMARYGLE